MSRSEVDVTSLSAYMLMINTPAQLEQSLAFVPLVKPLNQGIVRAFRRNAGWKHRDTQLDDQPLDARSEVQWVTVRRGMKLIGIARLEMAPSAFCYVSDLIVLDTYQRKGVGTWLMARIEDHCKARGIPRLLLRAGSGAQGFYDKLRFGTDPLVAGFLRKDLIALPFRVVM